jgi:hypothetical protein
MFITLALIGALGSQAQSVPREPSDAWYRAHLPSRIQVTQDVEAIPHAGTVERRRRGTLFIRPQLKAFQIKKGETFQMTKLLGEGECRIRFRKKDYEVESCPWLEGFRERETDIYKPVAHK